MILLKNANNDGYGAYKGEEGALRLAREYHYGLKDFPTNEADDCIKNSYSKLCVRFYDLKPTINAKKWINE